MEWRPIEEAPKRAVGLSEQVIAFDYEFSCFPFIALYRFAPEANLNGWYLEDLTKVNPTHWMPLPTPPQNDKGG